LLVELSWITSDGHFEKFCGFRLIGSGFFNRAGGVSQDGLGIWIIGRGGEDLMGAAHGEAPFSLIESLAGCAECGGAGLVDSRGGDSYEENGGFLFVRKFIEHLARGGGSFIEASRLKLGDGLTGPVADKLSLLFDHAYLDVAASALGKTGFRGNLLDLGKDVCRFLPAPIFDQNRAAAFQERGAD
jgi:hypothetical protein